MLSKAFSLLLAAALLVYATNPAVAQSSKSESLRRQVIQWGTNQTIAIKLNSGEKLKGRIVEIKFDTLAIQLVEQGKIVSRELQWTELNKVSLDNKPQKARKIGGFIALGVLATLVVVVAVALNDPNF